MENTSNSPQTLKDDSTIDGESVESSANSIINMNDFPTVDVYASGDSLAVENEMHSRRTIASTPHDTEDLEQEMSTPSLIDDRPQTKELSIPSGHPIIMKEEDEVSSISSKMVEELIVHDSADISKKNFVSNTLLENVRQEEFPRNVCPDNPAIEVRVLLETASVEAVQKEKFKEEVTFVHGNWSDDLVSSPKIVIQGEGVSSADTSDEVGMKSPIQVFQLNRRQEYVPNCHVDAHFVETQSTDDNGSNLIQANQDNLFNSEIESPLYFNSKVLQQGDEINSIIRTKSFDFEALLDQSREVEYSLSFHPDNPVTEESARQLEANSNQNCMISNNIECELNAPDDMIIQSPQEYYSRPDISEFWRGNTCYYNGALNDNLTQSAFNSFLTGAKYETSWSTAIDEGQEERYFYPYPAVGDDPCQLTWALENSVYERDDEQTEANFIMEAEKEDRVRIRYTRDYLLQFSDCILAFAFPEGLRRFTATGELPLKQFESDYTENPGRLFTASVIGGMEHIMFYNDMHFISNLKRPPF